MIRKSLYDKISKNLYQNGSLVVLSDIDIKSANKKWRPVLDSVLSRYVNLDKLEELSSIICVYCEWANIVDNAITPQYTTPPSLSSIPPGTPGCSTTQHKFPDDFKNLITFLLHEIENVGRIPIKREVYNPVSGNMEYELENGKFVRPGDPLLGPEVIIEFFPDKFVEHHIPEGKRLIRDKKIEDILSIN